MAVNTQKLFQSRRWLQSEDCHGLCRVLAALRARPLGRTVAQVMGGHVAEYLRPPQLVAVGTWDGRVQILTTEHLEEVDSLQFGRPADALRRYGPSASTVLDSLEWSPDGGLLAAGGSTSVWILTAEPLQVRRQTQLQRQASSFSLAWAPSGMRLAVAWRNNVVCLDPFSLEVLSKVALDIRQRCFARCIAWSASGERLAAGCEDGSLKLMAGDSLAVCASYDYGRWPVDHVTWAPNSDCLAAAFGLPPKLAIVDGRDFAVLRDVGFDGAVRCSAWSPDGERIAAGSYDTRVRLFAAGTLEKLQEARLYEAEGTGFDEVAELVWAADGGHLLAAARRGGVYILSAGSLDVLRSVGFARSQGPVYSLAWHGCHRSRLPDPGPEK